jgi:multiple sugar transport system permease protein
MAAAAPAVAQEKLIVWWTKGFYKSEDDALLSNDTEVTLAVGLGNFLAPDVSPWELLMATGLIYALPLAAIYYAFKRYMVSGLTAGAVKG